MEQKFEPLDEAAVRISVKNIKAKLQNPYKSVMKPRRTFMTDKELFLGKVKDKKDELDAIKSTGYVNQNGVYVPYDKDEKDEKDDSAEEDNTNNGSNSSSSWGTFVKKKKRESATKSVILEDNPLAHRLGANIITEEGETGEQKTSFDSFSTGRDSTEKITDDEVEVFTKMKVLYDYQPQYSDELELVQGTEIEIISTVDPNWFQGRVNGKIGLVPSNYVHRSSIDVQLLNTPVDSKSWVDFVGQEVAQTVSDDEKRRQEAIFELIYTEETFLQDMQMILDVFVFPLKQSGFFTEEEIISIFYNLPDLVTLGLKFLIDLKQIQSQDAHISSIGDVLVKHLDVYNSYAPYCGNIKRSIKILRKKKSNPEVFAFIQQCQENPSYNSKLDLESFMIKPMQRVSKMPLLVKGIIKYTPENHKDFPLLQEALAISHDSVLYVNVECGQSDEVDKREALQNRLNHEFRSILGPDLLHEERRVLLKTQHLTRVGLLGAQDKVLGVLFNDLLLLVKEESANVGMKYKLYAKPIYFMLADVEDGDEDVSKEKRQESVRLSYSPRFSIMKSNSKTELITPAKKDDPEQKRDRNIIKITDHGSDVVYLLKAATKRDKNLLLDDLRNTISKIPPGRFTFEKIVNLKTETGAPIDLSQTIILGKKYIYVGSEAVYIAPEQDPGQTTKLGLFKKKVCQMKISEFSGGVIVFMPTTNAKSGSLREYPLQSLLSSKGDAKGEIKFENTHGTMFFNIGVVDQVPLLVASTAKNVLIFQFDLDRNVYNEIAQVPLPKGSDGSECHCIFFHHRVYLSFNQKFYWFKDDPVLTPISHEFGQGGEGLAIFEVDGKLLMCYEDFGFFYDPNNDEVLEDEYFLKWTSKATGFYLFGPSSQTSLRSLPKVDSPMLVVLFRNYIEIWDLNLGMTVQMERFFYGKSLNEIENLFQVYLSKDVNQMPILCQLKERDQEKEKVYRKFSLSSNQ